MVRDLYIDKFLARARAYGSEAAYHTMESGTYKPSSWMKYGEEVKSFGAGLIKLGHKEREIVGGSMPKSISRGTA